jgi:hypothetical protein
MISKVIFLCGTAVVFAQAARAGEFIYSNRLDGIVVEARLPETPAVRGLVVQADGRPLAADDNWAVAAQQAAFGRVALRFEAAKPATNAAALLRAALERGLKELAEKSSRREVLTAPFLGVARGDAGLTTDVLLSTPERVLAVASHGDAPREFVSLTPEQRRVPMLFTLGALTPGAQAGPGTNYQAARMQNVPWALGWQWGCSNEFANAATLQIPWLFTAAAGRLPTNWNPLVSAPKLEDISPETAWSGSLATVSNQWAQILPDDLIQTNRQRSAWCADRGAAAVWRGWHTRDTAITLEVETAGGRARLGATRPGVARELVIEPGNVSVRLVVPKDVDLHRVRFFDGLASISHTLKAPPWNTTVTNITPGVHPILAIWETEDEKRGAANPILVVVREKPAKK